MKQRFSKRALEKLIERCLKQPPQYAAVDRRLRCAQYARLAAQDLFGVTYCRAPAWNLRYHNQEIWRPHESSVDWVDVVRPGLLIGMYNPASEENTIHGTSANPKTDELGLGRAYTHVALYLGTMQNERYVLQQFIERVECAELLPFLAQSGCVVRGVIAPQDWKIKGKRY